MFKKGRSWNYANRWIVGEHKQESCIPLYLLFSQCCVSTHGTFIACSNFITQFVNFINFAWIFIQLNGNIKVLTPLDILYK